MHNTDRTQQYLEAGPAHEFEFEFEHESQGEQAGEFEFAGEFEGGHALEMETGVSHEMEMELASELLGVTNEQELENFLGKLFKKVARGVGDFARSGAGKMIGGALKGIAKKALPALAGAAGNFLLPGVGGAIGAKLGGMAGNALGLELEGLSPEDREFEVARRIVRLGATATRQALRSPAGASPISVARSAMTVAARKHAPGLLRRPHRRGRHSGHRPAPGGSGTAVTIGPDGPAIDAGAFPAPAQSFGNGQCHCGGAAAVQPAGHWYRQGNSIVIEGV